MMKRLVKGMLVGAACLTALLTSNAYADNTGWNVVGRIQMTTAGVVYFRPRGYGGWGGTDCPDTTYVFIDKANSPVYDSLVAMAIASNLNSTNVIFYGTCNASGTYFEANYMLLEE